MDTAEVGCEVQFFKEKDEVLALIAASCNASTEREFEAAHAELSKILLNYLEQSQLILPHVPDLVDPINQKLTSLLVSLEDSASEDAKAAAMRQLFYVGNVSYSLCRVAGYKYVMKHFLHEVSHLESCLSLLNQQDRADHRWETRYVLLLWLAALCLIPFDICSMDSSLQIEPSQPVDASDATEPSESIESSSVPGPPARTLVTNIVTQCKAFLSDTGPTREAAAVCLSCLLTRPDMENAHLQEFMQWSVQQLEEWAQRPAAERATLSADYFCVLGVFLSVFQVFKLGHRTKLLPYGPLLLPHCFSLSGEECQTSLRKLIAKLVQRIGMNFLPPRVAKWRYLRGNRSLTFGGAAAAAGAGGAVGAMGSAAAEQGETQGGEIQGGGAAEGAEEEEDEEEAEVPMLMDDVMEHLLCALRDKDTVVRWSAAKGIGRITMRLAQEFAKDVIDAVIDAFSDPEADSNWQGGCLALAELSRRGLLLPERLFSVIPFVERAIQFDVLRGQHSIGAHVRDAACYVCWAFCRAYSPLVMAPFIRLLTTSLLTTALYDREVNCRRAASAAYQETVGRQGDQNVPHGIEIITIADYFAVGNRNSSFTSIAAAVVTLDRKLHQFFLMHLRAVKLQHWDRDVRRLASKALAHLVPIDPQASVALLAELVPACSSPHLNTRHGSILATSEVLSALTNCGVSLSEQLCAAVVGVLPAIEKARLFRGRGGEQIREAVCELVQSVARSRVPMSVKLQVLYVESLNEHLKQPHESVQHAARDALRAFFHAYFSTGAPPSERLQKLTVLKYMEGLDSEVNVCATRGYALALGVLPLRLAASPPGRLGEVLAALGASSSPSKLVAGEYDANTCCNCVEALMELAERVAESPQLSALQVGQCFSLLFRASEDYSVDKRGDTGSWSRTMALVGMERLVYACSRRVDAAAHRLAPVSEGQVGGRVSTCFGPAAVLSIMHAGAEWSVVRVVYPPKSLGDAKTSRPAHLHPDEAAIVLRKSTPAAPALAEEPLSLPATQLIAIVLKQLSEKLDAVRDVAGNALVRLLLFAERDGLLPLPQEQRAAFARAFAMHDAVGDVGDMGAGVGGAVSGPEGEQKINWTQPAHVYPFVCALLSCDAFFDAILSGLVISVGGLTETIAKQSAQALLAFCIQAQQEPSQLQRLAQGLAALLCANQRVDRVTLPTIKTANLLLREGVFDRLPRDQLCEFAEIMCAALLLEVKAAPSVVKICAALDLLALLLPLARGRPVRYQLMQALLPMLTHRYPRVRKACGESLYLHFLADEEVVGPTYLDHVAEGSSTDSRCCFFCCEADLEEALSVLSTTTWDAADKGALLGARGQVTRLMGFEVITAEAGAASSEEAPAGPDELDSYEALVRDAGY